MKNYSQDKVFNSYRYSTDFQINKVEELHVDKILSLIGKNKKVLDMGCGDGTISKRIKNTGNEVVGIEISNNAIRKAKEKKIKVYDLSLNSDWSKEISERFDIVFAGEIIEHILDTDHFLQNIKEVLKRKGKLIITSPNVAALGRRLMLLVGVNPFLETTRRLGDAGHVRYFTHASLEKLLRENDFQILSSSSLIVNLHTSGRIYSKLLAKLIPTFGNNIIISAQKIK